MFKKREITSLDLNRLLSSISKKQNEFLSPLISASPPRNLRKTVYLSSGGKYSKYEDFLRIFTFKTGYVPVHPVSTLGYFTSSYSHEHNKSEIVRDCFSLLLAVDELWVFEEKLPSFDKSDLKDKKYISDFSEGVIAEIYFWLTNKPNSPIRFFTFKDAGIPKYLSKDWSLVKDGDTSDTNQSGLPKVFAIIDLGSSTVKLTVCSIKEDNISEVLYKKAITVNLAEGFFEEKILQSNAVKRTIQAVFDLQKEALSYGVLDIKMVGTGVIRQAKNLSDFKKDVKEKAKLDLEVLTGEREAKLIYKAVSSSFENISNDLVVVNAGGGTTELVVGKNEKVKYIYNLPVGITDLNEKFTKDLPLDLTKYKKMKSYINKMLQTNIKRAPTNTRLVYTGGELDYMIITGFPLENFSGHVAHPKKIGFKKFVDYANKMKGMNREELHAFMPENPRWMDGAVSSNAILECIANYFKCEVIIPSNKNLNDGILLEMIE